MTQLHPAKVVLLAIHFTSSSDLDSLSTLIAQYKSVLRQDLVLRILLSYLPETVHPHSYVSFLQSLASEHWESSSPQQFDIAAVNNLSDAQASNKIKNLHLIPLSRPDGVSVGQNNDLDSITLFLLLRGCRMDEEAGMLSLVPELLNPFRQHSPEIGTWLVSTVLPLWRRNCKFYPQAQNLYTLPEFQNLSDRSSVDYLLSETLTSQNETVSGLLGRDMKGLIGPWLCNAARWVSDADGVDGEPTLSCPGWEQALDRLLEQAPKSWKMVVSAVEQWDGIEDIDTGEGGGSWLEESQEQYLDKTYARAALGSAYLVSEPTTEALHGAYQIASKIKALMDQGNEPGLQAAAVALFPVSSWETDEFPGAKTASFMRNDLLQDTNPLTTPRSCSIDLLLALILSAFLLTRSGVPCSIKNAGDLVFIQDVQEQKGELAKLLRALSENPSRSDDYWIQARREIIWLHQWGREPASGNDGSFQGLFGLVSRTYIETEILRALLSTAHYTLAKSIYEDAPDRPLPESIIQDAVQATALAAFDNATNPNRTRGGLKKCSEILHAFPATMPQSLPATMRIEALLKATHGLSDYRLVLKQGELFSPVVLRVHSDPIVILEKVLQQNPKAYTRLQEFLEIGANMVRAGLCCVTAKQNLQSDQMAATVAARRIVAMCITAALAEDDFETAYSYVVSRLDDHTQMKTEPSYLDDWSWKAALEAGKYILTDKSQKPTHLGTANGNPEIRHLEQRIECLATALRIAPPSQLQEVLKTFRRCEEQLDFAIKAEVAREDEWHESSNSHQVLPGSFESPYPQSAHPSRNPTASATARQAEETPMSLFDLSRATARAAQKNFTALSSLQGITEGIARGGAQTEDSPVEDLQHGQRLRKRDQLRDAATGTLVSGVGWLLGANPNRGDESRT